MTKQELLEMIKDALQREEELSEGMLLEELDEWDSLAVVSLIALYGDFGIKLTGDAIRQCKSVDDLLFLAKGKVDDI